jgi:sugar lactone lactonase YvrE/enterochelin esterase-like enzyme
MKVIPLAAALVLLAGTPLWAANSLSASPGPNQGMNLVGERNHQRIPVSRIEGKLAWSFPANPHGRHELFEIADDDFKDGGHPSVVFTVDYYDQGAGPVVLEYDSLGSEPGSQAKRAGVIRLGDTKTWKQATFAVTDARFDDRYGEADFGFSIPPNFEFALGGVSIALGTAPPSVQWTQTPRGKIYVGSYDASKIFPGTQHRYIIYVPKEYDGTKPACIYVAQDGYKREFGSVFNHLIYNKQMPVTVGIFISPGTVLAPDMKTQANRGNRCYEYDSLGPDFARFLLDEMIPFVAKTYNLNLSQDPNDHAIGGASSGGICAFNAAWERPDGFRRVYSASGSFAAFRGGDILPLMVREFEPKPIRAFLYVGTDDMVNAGGDWNQANHEMDRALKFAGYDYSFNEKVGRHTVDYVDGFADGMKWLWRDYPAPITPGKTTGRLQDVLIPGQDWTVAGQGSGNIAGIAVSPKGEVFFCDSGANRIDRIGADGAIQTAYQDGQQVNALTFGPDGGLYGVSAATGNVVAFNANGGGVISSGIRGHDIIAPHSGGLYVTEPGAPGAASSKVWYISPGGEKKVVDTGLEKATGLAISPDGWLLDVADGASHWVYSYKINPDGTLSDKQHFFWLHVPDDADDSGVDGLCFERAEAKLFAATRMGIQTLGTQGHAQGIIVPPGQPLGAICLGGPDFNILYAACGDKIYKRQVLVKGIHSFDAPVKPGPGKL